MTPGAPRPGDAIRWWGIEPIIVIQAGSVRSGNQKFVKMLVLGTEPGPLYGGTFVIDEIDAAGERILARAE